MFCTSTCCNQGPLPAAGGPGLWRVTAWSFRCSPRRGDCISIDRLSSKGGPHAVMGVYVARSLWSCWGGSFPCRLPGSWPQLPSTSLHVSLALGAVSAEANPTQASAGQRPCRPSPARLSHPCRAGRLAVFPLWPKAHGSWPWSRVPVPGPALCLDQVDK